MIEGNSEQDDLNSDHDDRLYEQTRIELRAGIVEDPVGGQSVCAGEAGGGVAHLRKDATSMISGMSSEKPALDRLRCIEMAWSP